MSVGETAQLKSLAGRSATVVAVMAVLIRFCRRKPLGASGGALLIFMAVCALFAPIIAPYSPDTTNMGLRLLPPGPSYWLGTDFFGRDMLSRIIFGAQVSVGIGFATIALSTIIAAVMGVVSAYWEGKVDLITQRFVDGVQALPTLVVVLAAGFALGRGALTLVLLLAFLFGVRSSRVVRSAALSAKQNDYVLAAHALGGSDIHVIARHILPNLFAPIMIVSTVQLGAVILTESSLSFLGLGVPPPAISWGQMLTVSTGGSSIGVIDWMVRAPWIVVTPGIVITAVVWGANMFGDALRDVLDPRMRGRA